MSRIAEITDIAWKALEQEDRSIQESISSNPGYYANDKGGILLINNERYYQFVIAKMMFSKIKCRVEVEKNQHDLVLSYSDSEIYIIEMKRWMSGTGNREIPNISSDIDKLSKVSGNKLLMVFSVNPLHSTQENLRHLSQKLMANGVTEFCNYRSEHRTFNTYDIEGKLVEFWIASFEIY